ncbi:regulator of microtubule dynamics protein 1-like [Venturia canescens]|uniref:regulator of microtubule dynamics protein 1-like n=1 Tax=Venturia canescens TaxID=32260 RepID=UPI001C9D1C64|nr:regulator of microtubule dynamics protein 1-like [Venturia canescens]XP_043278148.1 regulator of microtubule dynamics protein 1-like [Venturia canescens]
MTFQNVIRIVRTSGIVRRAFLHQLFIVARKVNFLPTKLILGAPLIAQFTKLDPLPPSDVTKAMLAEADALFEQGKYLNLYEKFKNYKDGSSAEMLWRLSRALYHMSKSANPDEAKAMIYEAYDLVSKALSLEDDISQVHKWYTVLLDSKSEYEGKKARIQQLQTVKNHMLRALELNPKDATILYMLGNWCYCVADLAWYQRKIAAVIFAAPPTSSFQEALEFLLKAEEIDPNFYSQNLLLLGKTYLKLNNKEEGVKYLKMASEYPARNNDDQDAKQEATKLLSGL